MRTKTRGSLEQFSARFSPNTISKWTAIIEAWDDDPTQPNPYADARSSKYSRDDGGWWTNQSVGTTFADVRLALAAEDLQGIASGSLPPHQMSSGKFLQMGMDIEDQQ
jgi:hypothetical protein